MSVTLENWIEAESRELALTVDTTGKVASADARARRLLGIAEGSALEALAVPGTEDKARELLARATMGDIRNFELSLRREGLHPVTVSFCGCPGDDRTTLLLGSVFPDSHADVVGQMNQALSEVVDLNREVVRQKRELERQKAELERALAELGESNRGVIALHKELQEKAESLRRSADVKSRVVTNVSHEFRTPLHTILGLSKLLLDESDVPLSSDQETQIRFIRSSAEELSSLINDLLDLSKAEAGKMSLRAETFALTDLFSALRGMLKPLVSVPDALELVFDQPPVDVVLETDQGKIAQIIRNLVSNALKFTESGEVRVTSQVVDRNVIIRVSDTGIGIAPENIDTIFEEFTQIDGPVQRRSKGTGIGLSLSRKLAELLGGSLSVESRLGKGSVFTLLIPLVHPEVREVSVLKTRPLDPARAPVLVVEDDRKTIFMYEKYLAMTGFQVVPVRTTAEARRVLETTTPAAIVLDVMLEEESTWSFLADLKRDPRTHEIPVLVVTVSSQGHKARALGADEFWLKPVDRTRLVKKLESLSRPSQPAKLLVIDDDERSRYIMRKLLANTSYTVLEAANGRDGASLAQTERPQVILLDFLLKEETAFDIIDDLKADPRTRSIPVIIVTSQLLDPTSRQRLESETEAVLSKASLSRELAINRIRDALRKAGTGSRHVEEAS